MGTGELYRAQQAEERRRQAVRDSQRYKDDIGHDKDKNLAGIQKVISVNNITISRADIKAEEARLAAFGVQYAKAFSKAGKTWSMRHNEQTQAIRAREAQQHDLRYEGLRAAKINPINIQRWEEEDRIVQEAEEERLLQIQLEKERLQEIENQRLQEIENQRLAEIENQRLAEIENQRLQIRYTWEIENNQRLQEIEDQEITFNEQQNSGDFNDTPITEINPMDSCSGCGVDIHGIQQEMRDKENYLKIGGIAAVGIGILLLYTRRNKK